MEALPVPRDVVSATRLRAERAFTLNLSMSKDGRTVRCGAVWCGSVQWECTTRRSGEARAQEKRCRSQANVVGDGAVLMGYNYNGPGLVAGCWPWNLEIGAPGRTV